VNVLFAPASRARSDEPLRVARRTRGFARAVRLYSKRSLSFGGCMPRDERWAFAM